MKHPSLSFLSEALDALAQQGLRRDAAPPLALPMRGAGDDDDAAIPSLCSNDYLGLADAQHDLGGTSFGAGASRLLRGDRAEHRALEQALAGWVDAESALLFTSGYAANLGLVSALARPGDRIVSDRLNHASLIDGARLSRAEIAVVPHLDLAAVDAALDAPCAGRRWVLVESYYSMDADGPDLAALRALCDRHGAGLIVDEAHALGVLGPDGRGRCAEAGIRPDALVGTLGKSLGSQGAFVAGPAVLRDWLWNRARSFVFSTGLSPACAAAAHASLARLVAEPGLRGIVLARAAQLREGLAAAAPAMAPAVLGFGHVVPVVLGDASTALRVAAAMREQGVEVHAIRPPTVPAGTARLRMTVTARHRADHIERVVAAYAHAIRERETP